MKETHNKQEEPTDIGLVDLAIPTQPFGNLLSMMLNTKIGRFQRDERVRILPTQLSSCGGRIAGEGMSEEEFAAMNLNDTECEALALNSLVMLLTKDPEIRQIGTGESWSIRQLSSMIRKAILKRFPLKLQHFAWEELTEQLSTSPLLVLEQNPFNVPQERYNEVQAKTRKEIEQLLKED